MEREVLGLEGLRTWLQASRLPSQAYIFFPLLLGQSLAYAQTGGFSWPIFVLTHLLGLSLQLYIVYANDYADRNTDAANTTYTSFSGGSRVLVKGLLAPAALKKAVWLCIALSLLLALFMAAYFQRYWTPLFVIASIALLWAYSFPPLQLSYRGGGEFLQVIGVAVLLPALGFYVQNGALVGLPPALFAILVPVQLSCALSTGLPDWPSDRLFGKRTMSVLFSFPTVQIAILMLNLLGVLLLLFIPLVTFYSTLVLASLILVFTMLMATQLRNSPPGSLRLNRFVWSNIMATVSLNAGSSVYFFLP